MNAGRRKRLRTAHDYLSSAAGILEEVLNEEQDCLDNTPENLQESAAYEAREDTIDALEDALEGATYSMNVIMDLM